jgi:maleate isomerase
MTEQVRLGVIVPSVNIVVEEWYPRVVPDRVSVHFARMLIGEGSSPEWIIAMDRDDGVRAIRQLATCRPHAVAYGCTASSIVQGHAFDEHLRNEIRHIAEAPATTATDSIFAACRALGLKRVTAISPEAVDAAEHRFFAAGGIDCVADAHLGIADGFRLAEPAPEAILDLALRAWDPQSDGLIAACLNFRSHPIIDALEARIEKPVVTSTQAVLWHLLRLAGVTTPIPGFGRLLREF